MSTPAQADLTHTPEPAAASPTPPPETGLKLTSYDFQTVAGGLLFIATVENTQADDLTDLELSLAFLGADGSVAAFRTVRAIPDSLPPGGTAGLWVLLDPHNGELEPQIRSVSVSDGTAYQGRLRLKVLDTRHTAGSQAIILGEITNPGAEYLRLEDMLLLPASIGEGPQGAARPLLAPQGIPPGETLPFAAELLGEAPENGWHSFLDSSPSGIPDSPPIEIQSGPTLRHSAQSRPFYTLQLRNTGSLPRWLAGEVAFYRDGTLMALARLSSPIPIRAGETRPISISEFVGLEAGTDLSPAAMKDWQVQLKIDALASRPALEEIRTLALSVTQFEVIGGLIFMRGELTNQDSEDVMHPSALITARDVSGRLLDSAWANPSETLASGATVEFELTMLLPASTTAELSEFDLQGLGLSSP
ncbi:MAG: FxLYD domain-containing protein [Anaerolineales bacterium]|jgi:hypothetical protein